MPPNINISDAERAQLAKIRGLLEAQNLSDLEQPINYGRFIDPSTGMPNVNPNAVFDPKTGQFLGYIEQIAQPEPTLEQMMDKRVMDSMKQPVDMNNFNIQNLLRILGY